MPSEARCDSDAFKWHYNENVSNNSRISNALLVAVPSRQMAPCLVGWKC